MHLEINRNRPKKIFEDARSNDLRCFIFNANMVESRECITSNIEDHNK
jgi:hypothetical protein